MVRVKKSFVFLVLLFNLIACSGQLAISTGTPVVTATFTPYIGGTETALAAERASPTAWVAGTETALAIASASPTGWVPGTETALAAPSHTPTLVPTLPPLPEGTFSPVFYGRGPFLLVGGVKTDQGWLSGVHAAQYVSNETSYEFFSPNGFFQVPGDVLEFSPVCGNYSMRSSVVLPEPMIGVASGWLSTNRPVIDLSIEASSYTQVLMEWFQSQGNPPAEIRVTRILQADIEGDGVNEVLISASYFKDPSGHMVETGDYSIVLMRKVAGNDVLTIPLVKEYYVTSLPEAELIYPLTYSLAGALDLNHDGILEVIVDVSRWEGGGAIVYRVDGQNVRAVMQTIC